MIEDCVSEDGEYLNQLLRSAESSDNEFEKRAVFSLTDYIKALSTDQIFSK